MWAASEGRRGPGGVVVVAASWMAICGDERLCTLAWPRSLKGNMLSLALRSAAASGICGGAIVVTAGSVMVARADRGGSFEDRGSELRRGTTISRNRTATDDVPVTLGVCACWKGGRQEAGIKG